MGKKNKKNKAKQSADAAEQDELVENEINTPREEVVEPAAEVTFAPEEESKVEEQPVQP